MISNRTNEQAAVPFLEKYQLGIFFSITLVLSAVIAFIAVTVGDENFAILTVFTPSLTAIFLTALINGKVGVRELLVSQTSQQMHPRWLIASLFTIPGIAITATVLHSLAGGSPLALRTTEVLPQVIVILLIALGEEYGWRGYALPKLQERYNALISSLILGLVWAFWHFPGYLIGTGVPLDMPFPVFVLWVLPATILITWVYNNTKSILSAIFMHMAANAAFNYLYLLPEFTGQLNTFWVFLGVLWLVTITITISFGYTSLTGKTNRR